MAKKPVVLFLCSHNSARSQMAEGILRDMAGDRFEAHSAGMEPGDLHPLAVRAMGEVGVDISRHKTKAAASLIGRLPVRHLIIVCGQAAESCPTAWPGVLSREVWPFPDPSQAKGTEEQRLLVFREVRDGIQARISEWLAGISASAKRV